MSEFQLLVDGVCVYSGYDLGVAASAFDVYAGQVRHHGGQVVLLQDGEEVKTFGG